jgi:predicted nuclease with TOPRIM domain
MENTFDKMLEEIKGLREDVRGLGEQQAETAAILRERCKAHWDSIERNGEDIKSLYAHTNKLREEANGRLANLNNSINKQEILGEHLEKIDARLQKMEQTIAKYIGMAVGLAWLLSFGTNLLFKLVK